MAVDLMPKRNFIETVLPVLAGPVYPNAGVGGAWGAWVQVIPAAGAGSIAFPFVLHGAYLTEQFTLFTISTNVAEYHFQVGIGAAGFEVPIAQGAANLVGILSFVFAANATIIATKTMWFEPVVVPAGTRIAVRAWGSAAIAIQFGTFLVGYDASNYELPAELMSRPHERYIKGISSPVQGANCYPNPASTPIVPAAAPAWGVWTVWIAAAANDILMTGVASVESAIGSYAQVQIGIGPAAAEVAGAQVGLAGRTFGPVGASYLPRPLFVKQGERVALRAMSPTAILDMVLMGHEVK